MTWLLIGVGGGLGAIARHATNRLLIGLAMSAQFPLGIFVINVVGSGLIGLIAGAVAGSRISLSTEARAFLTVGVLGGFTTFSSFSLDTLTMIKGGHLAMALLNVLGQVGLSLMAVLLGYRLGLAL